MFSATARNKPGTFTYLAEHHLAYTHIVIKLGLTVAGSSRVLSRSHPNTTSGVDLQVNGQPTEVVSVEVPLRMSWLLSGTSRQSCYLLVASSCVSNERRITPVHLFGFCNYSELLLTRRRIILNLNTFSKRIFQYEYCTNPTVPLWRFSAYHLRLTNIRF